MFKKFWFLFLVLVIEGASLMAVELMGAKLFAPFYGSSLYVWTAVLGITVLVSNMKAKNIWRKSYNRASSSLFTDNGVALFKWFCQQNNI